MSQGSSDLHAEQAELGGASVEWDVISLQQIPRVGGCFRPLMRLKDGLPPLKLAFCVI